MTPALQRTAWLGLFLISGAWVLSRYEWFDALGVGIYLITTSAWLGILGLATWAAGAPLCRWLFPDVDDHVTRAVFTLCLGAGVLMAVAGAAGALHLLHGEVLFAVLGLLACRGGILAWRAQPRPKPPASPLWLLLGAVAGLSLLAASTLSPLYDVWHYQLAFPFHWLRAAAIHVQPLDVYSYFPANMGLLYVYGLAGPGAWAAQLTHLAMGGIAVLGAVGLARILRPDHKADLAAAVIFAATPTMIAIASEAMADLGVAAFAGAAWLAVLTPLPEDPGKRRRRAIAAGCFAGLAAGCKVLALATVMVPVVVVAAWLWWVDAPSGRRLRTTALQLAAFGLAVALVFGPWALRNLVLTHNPVYPFLGQVFSPTDNEITQQHQEWVGGFSVAGRNVRQALTLTTYEPLGTGGDIGPVFLWLLPLWLVTVVMRPRSRIHLLILAGFVLTVIPWVVGRPLGRYLLPGLLLASAGAGAALVTLCERLGSAGKALVWGVLCVVMVGNINPARTGYAVERIGCALGFWVESEMLQRYVSLAPAIAVVNSELPEDAVILLVGDSRSYAIERRVVVEDPFRAPLLVDLANHSRHPGEIAAELRRQGITHLLCNWREARRVATANRREEYLECRDEAARARLQSFFDGQLVRQWRAGELEILALPLS